MSMKKSKKSDVNKTHPMLGYRVKAETKIDLMSEISIVTELHNKANSDFDRPITTTDIFRKALRLGLAELKKKKNL